MGRLVTSNPEYKILSEEVRVLSAKDYRPLTVGGINGLYFSMADWISKSTKHKRFPIIFNEGVFLGEGQAQFIHEILIQDPHLEGYYGRWDGSELILRDKEGRLLTFYFPNCVKSQFFVHPEDCIFLIDPMGPQEEKENVEVLVSDDNLGHEVVSEEELWDEDSGDEVVSEEEQPKEVEDQSEEEQSKEEVATIDVEVSEEENNLVVVEDTVAVKPKPNPVKKPEVVIQDQLEDIVFDNPVAMNSLKAKLLQDCPGREHSALRADLLRLLGKETTKEVEKICGWNSDAIVQKSSTVVKPKPKPALKAIPAKQLEVTFKGRAARREELKAHFRRTSKDEENDTAES